MLYLMASPGGQGDPGSYGSLIVVIIIIFVLVIALRRKRNNNPRHWQHLFDGFQYSAKDFYNQVVAEIKLRNIHEVTFTREAFLEGSMFGPKRESLRVCRGDVIIDVGAAAFGTGFFVSWWMGE